MSISFWLQNIVKCPPLIKRRGDFKFNHMKTLTISYFIVLSIIYSFNHVFISSNLNRYPHLYTHMCLREILFTNMWRCKYLNCLSKMYVWIYVYSAWFLKFQYRQQVSFNNLPYKTINCFKILIIQWHGDVSILLSFKMHSN